MRAVAKANFTTVPFLVGALLFLCALTFYYLAVLRVDYSKTALLDLGPHPDATEYFAQAKALLKDGWPSVQIGYDRLPSRYPFGYPALMLPWLKILPTADAVLAPFRTNQTLGLLLLLAVFAFYAYLAMPLTGGFATLVLATLPGFFTFCRSSMSEISASLFIGLAFMLAYLGLKKERRWKIYLSAVLLGLSVNIRIQSIFFAPLLLVMALFPVRGERWRWFLHCVALPIVFILAASPVLLLNAIQFHSPFKTGYDFWVPSLGEQHLLFALHYIPGNAAALWREFALQQNRFFAANIFGTGTSFVPAFMLLIFAGLPFIRTSRFTVCSFLANLSFVAATLCYRFGADRRFYLPVLLLLIAVAVLPVRWAAKNIFVKRHALAALSIFILFAAACLGYPSRSGYNTTAINRSQAWDALHFTTPPRKSIRFIAQKHFIMRFGRGPGIVLSDIDPVYLNALFPEGMLATPLDEKHHYQFSKIWRYGRPQALALVERGLEQSLPIYGLFTSTKEMTARQSRLPVVSGHQWTIINNSQAEAVVLKLASSESEEKPPL
jgi:hypothetical protein